MSIIQQISQCLLEEADALKALAKQIDEAHLEVLNLISDCSGKCCFTGVGKSFIVASKIASSFCSLGFCSISIDPLRLLHGDLGSLSKADIVFALSNSGETEILLQAMEHIKGLGLNIISMTGNANSSLAKSFISGSFAISLAASISSNIALYLLYDSTIFSIEFF